MARPTVMEGWWGLLLQQSGGRVDLLAQMLEVSPRTINRWYQREIRFPGPKHKRVLRDIAGKALLAHEDCPKYLRVKTRG